MSAQDVCRVAHRGREHGQVLQQHCSALAFEARHSQRLERQSCLRHELHLQSALCSNQHDFSSSTSRKPFFRNGYRRKNVASGAAACDEELHALIPFIIPDEVLFYLPREKIAPSCSGRAILRRLQRCKISVRGPHFCPSQPSPLRLFGLLTDLQKHAGGQ